LSFFCGTDFPAVLSIRSLTIQVQFSFNGVLRILFGAGRPVTALNLFQLHICTKFRQLVPLYWPFLTQFPSYKKYIQQEFFSKNLDQLFKAFVPVSNLERAILCQKSGSLKGCLCIVKIAICLQHI
jgi:hypothetical protein